MDMSVRFLFLGLSLVGAALRRGCQWRSDHDHRHEKRDLIGGQDGPLRSSRKSWMTGRRRRTWGNRFRAFFRFEAFTICWSWECARRCLVKTDGEW